MIYRSFGDRIGIYRPVGTKLKTCISKYFPSDYFRNILQVFVKHSSRKNCVLIKISKKQIQIKELENSSEGKRKARSYFILNEFFIKKKKKTSGKARKKKALVKLWLKYRAHSSVYDNLLNMHISRLKDKKQPLANVLYFSDVL